MVFNQYYAQYMANPGNLQRDPSSAPFDFNTTMRTTRITVDNYLAQGQVQQAEQYMESQRQLLMSKGYYIRKLNQAYFAFYGSYATGPASVDPIGQELSTLRQHSPSIKDFLNTVSGFGSNQDLNNAINQYK